MPRRNVRRGSAFLVMNITALLDFSSFRAPAATRVASASAAFIRIVNGVLVVMPVDQIRQPVAAAAAALRMMARTAGMSSAVSPRPSA